MAHDGTWAAKDPDEIKDYGFNWAGTSDLPGIAFGDPILSSTWILPSGATLVKNSDTFTSGTTTIWLSGGDVGVTYVLTNRITTAGLRTYDESIKLKCKEK